MSDEPAYLRREDDRRIERLTAAIEHLSADMEKMSNTLTAEMEKIRDTLAAITDGTKTLPQCRDNVRRIEASEKKIAQHSYSDLNQRVVILEQDRKEQKAVIGWTLKTAIGAIIIGLINLLWGKITQ